MSTCLTNFIQIGYIDKGRIKKPRKYNKLYTKGWIGGKPESQFLQGLK